MDSAAAIGGAAEGGRSSAWERGTGGGGKLDDAAEMPDLGLGGYDEDDDDDGSQGGDEEDEEGVGKEFVEGEEGVDNQRDEKGGKKGKGEGKSEGNEMDSKKRGSKEKGKGKDKEREKEKRERKERDKKAKGSGGKGQGDSAVKKGKTLLQVAVAEVVKEALRPLWKEKEVSKEAFKSIAKRAVVKVVGSVEAKHMPRDAKQVAAYLTDGKKEKIEKLVQVGIGRVG